MFHSINVVGEIAAFTEKTEHFISTVDHIQASNLKGINIKIIELLEGNL